MESLAFSALRSNLIDYTWMLLHNSANFGSISSFLAGDFWDPQRGELRAWSMMGDHGDEWSCFQERLAVHQAADGWFMNLGSPITISLDHE